MSALRISILIPTFNRSGLLAKAVESALAQTYPDLEVLVSDNASTDDTATVMARFEGDPRLHYLRNAQNIGMVPNWRQLLLRATGDCFLLLSDDDELIDPEYLKKATDLLQRHEDMVLVYANGYILDTRTGLRRELRLPFQEVENGSRVFANRDRVKPQDFTLCNVIFRRALALDLEAFSNPHNICCDSELFLNSCLFGKVGVIQNFVSLYRVHSGNLIATIDGNFDLLAHRLDMYLNPLRLAEKRNCLSKQEREAFEWVMRRMVRRTLLTICANHRARYPEFLAYLESRRPGLARKAMIHPKFWLKRIKIRWHQRRRLSAQSR